MYVLSSINAIASTLKNPIEHRFNSIEHLSRVSVSNEPVCNTLVQEDIYTSDPIFHANKIKLCYYSPRRRLRNAFIGPFSTKHSILNTYFNSIHSNSNSGQSSELPPIMIVQIFMSRKRKSTPRWQNTSKTKTPISLSQSISPPSLCRSVGFKRPP